MTNLSVRNVDPRNESGGWKVQLSHVDLVRREIDKTRQKMVFNWRVQNFTSEEDA